MKTIVTCSLTLLLALPLLQGQDTIPLDRYKRAVQFLWSNLDNKRVHNLHIRPHWFDDKKGLWFVNRQPEQKEYRQIDLATMATTPLFDHTRLAAVLSDTLDEAFDPHDLPISYTEYKSDEEISFACQGTRFVLDLHDYSLRRAAQNVEKDPFQEISPDSQWTAYVEDYNLYIKSSDGQVKQLSKDGRKQVEYATWYGWADIMYGEGGERPEHFYVSWSEDSQWLRANRCDLTRAEKMYLLDWSVDTLYRPRLLSYYRASPGDTTLIYEEPVFYHAATGREVRSPLGPQAYINGTSVRWSETPGVVYLLQQSRGYQSIALYRFHLDGEQLDTLYQEFSETNIDNFRYRVDEEAGYAFILSEKSGWRQIHRINLETSETQAVTQGAFYVNDIIKMDSEQKRLYFTASGREAGSNPYHRYFYCVGYHGGDLKLLTPDDCHHDISLMPEGRYFVDNRSTANRPTETVLCDLEDGIVLEHLGQADVSALPDWTPPQVCAVKARDGQSTIYAALWKPTDFDPQKKYPIIDHSYTGPHTQMFPRDFRRTLAIGNQALAELGFVVMMVDGLGSSGRSKAFQDHSYKNLGGNLEDHIAAIRQLSEQYAWIDTNRVGIFGHSAGGYDAGRAVLAYPDFYKVAVASSADHDHRMEKAWWPEMYMGWPVDSAYHLQSNVTNAGNLKGKLLITHGGIDENVNPSATFKLAEALIRADKPFDMLILPSQRHGYRGPHGRYFTKTRWNYFVRHLLGLEPRWDFAWE